ncbi:MAG: pyridoxal phosphate-dependent aminotransferase [Clostridia bacterium]|nr:pyridoxal phosphate-dependent aminotransferase [Clostridia bacterium]
MVNQELYNIGKGRTVIRRLFDYGKEQQKLGHKVYDFSLGNPNVQPPKEVIDTIRELAVENPDGLHEYTLGPGLESTRQAIADNLNRRFGLSLEGRYVFMTVGASPALRASFEALKESPDDEIVMLAPYFPEYPYFIRNAGVKPVIVPCKDDLTPDFAALKQAINQHTKAVIVNSPNNPSGVVYDEATTKELVYVLEEKQRELGRPLIMITDEPYRELVYVVPDHCFAADYDNSIICYSFSKSLSLPGERIGYVAVNPKMQNADAMYWALSGAIRMLGYVCAPSLFQRVVERCIDAKPNMDLYSKNRDRLYKELTRIGFECIKPQGAFYICLKAPNGDSEGLSELAKSLGILIIPCDEFGAKGFVRIAYCVTEETITDSIPAFEKLYKLINK